MSLFKTRGMEGREEQPSKWLKPPQAAILKCVKVFADTSNTGTQFIKFILSGPPKDGIPKHEYGTGQIVELPLWFKTDKSIDISKNTLVVMADRLGTRDKLDDIVDTAETYDELAAGLDKLYNGMKMSVMVSGEETWIKDKETGKYGETPWLKPVVNTLRSWIRPESKHMELVKKLENDGEEKYIKRVDKPGTDPLGGGSSAPVDPTKMKW